MQTSTVNGVIASASTITMNPAPIEPSWLLEGNPVARSGGHSRNVDGWASTNLWDCTAGRFRWHFGWEETVMILEGEVRVTSPSQQTHVLKPGDIAYFPAGTWWTWEVDHYVRKIAFCRRQVSWLTRTLGNLRSSVGGLLRGGASSAK